MNRRLFLTGAALAAAGLGAAALGARPLRASVGAWTGIGVGGSFDTALRYPGRELGHLFRDVHGMSQKELSVLPVLARPDTLIIGSGAAALSCAWQLNKGGMTDFLMLDGPAPLGNAAYGRHAYSQYPQGAHYLPVPNQSCRHVRHILQDLGVLLEGVDDEAPRYDERYLVHASAERVFHDNRWHAGILPELPSGSPEALQWQRVQEEFHRLAQLQDKQGRSVFQVPVAQGAALALDETRILDTLTFAQWLQKLGVEHPLLRWYFDYCCRDEYGVDASLTSAWAGVHYFSVQHGKAMHAEPNALLTAPHGLGFLAQGLSAKISATQRMQATALRVQQGPGAAYRVAVHQGNGTRGVIEAKNVVIATPLFVARRLAPEAFAGLESARGLSSSPWMLANFFLERFPTEQPGEQLSWDNVVSGSPSLGYIVATHQNIRAARPDGTVFSTYHALGEADNQTVRKRLAKASAEELLQTATRDLDQVYGRDWRRWCRGAELTLHGHAMSVPSPGFLSDPVVQRARQANDSTRGLFFAHSDLSGYSVFEEATYWGVHCAQQRLVA